MGTIEINDKCQWNHKNIRHETRTRTYRFRTTLSYPLCHGNHWNGISDKCRWNHKNIRQDSKPDLLFVLVVLTPLLSFISELKKVGNFGLEKKRPYRMKNFSCILHIRWKTKKTDFSRGHDTTNTTDNKCTETQLILQHLYTSMKR